LPPLQSNRHRSQLCKKQIIKINEVNCATTQKSKRLTHTVYSYKISHSTGAMKTANKKNN